MEGLSKHTGLPMVVELKAGERKSLRCYVRHQHIPYLYFFRGHVLLLRIIRIAFTGSITLLTLHEVIVVSGYLLWMLISLV